MTPALDAVALAAYSERDVIEKELARGGVAEHDIEDAVQDVLMTALHAAERGTLAFSPRWAFRSWLRTVARRQANVYRQRAALAALLPKEEPHEAPSPEDRYLAREMLRVLAASTTPERWKTMRSYAAGISVHEIAKRDGIRAASVYNRLRLAREDFAAALAREAIRKRQR